MHGSLNAQSYVGMQNKPNRLGCYIYSHKNRTILQTCDAILSKKLQMCIIDIKTAFDLYWRKNKPKFEKNILDK